MLQNNKDQYTVQITMQMYPHLIVLTVYTWTVSTIQHFGWHPSHYG